MAWSTRQLAELAGTTLRAVRHYHEVGLLEEPERQANGYKRYGVAHLVRVLHIKRLTDLGFSLTQIAVMGDADEHPEEALRTLDAELAGTIERLQRVRLELSLILRRSTPTDLPPELAEAAADADLTDADRGIIVVMTRVLGPSALDAYRELLRGHRFGPGDAEFNALPADADEQTRQDLAELLAPGVRAILSEHPELKGEHNKGIPAKTVAVAMADIYNAAQVDVMHRIGRMLQSPPEPDGN